MINYKFISLPKIYKYLNGNEWLLFTVLFDEWQLMKNEEGYFFRSWNSLKEDTGLSNNGLNSALKGLIEKNFISKKTYEKKTQKSNDYRIEVDYIASLIPTLNREKASLKKGVGYSQNESTSKEKRTKEKINKTIDTIGPSTRNSDDEKYEELSFNFSSSSTGNGLPPILHLKDIDTSVPGGTMQINASIRKRLEWIENNTSDRKTMFSWWIDTFKDAASEEHPSIRATFETEISSALGKLVPGGDSEYLMDEFHKYFDAA